MTNTGAPTRIGVSGHQARPGIDWDWTGAQIRRVLQSNAPVERTYTSLAVGSDQLFGLEALGLGIPVTAVIPLPDYQRFFKGAELSAYKAILSRCEVVELAGDGNDERSFLAAGRYVVDVTSLLVAIWDGNPAAGIGGTADIVRYCSEQGRPVVHINPITKTVGSIEPRPA